MALKLIIAVFALLVLFTAFNYFYNPAEKLREDRDKQRETDLTTLKKALDFYITKNAKNGSPLCDSCNLRKSIYSFSEIEVNSFVTQAIPLRWVNGTGWIPVDFSLNAGLGETPLVVLPVDPFNKDDYIYTYTPGENGKYKITAKMESKRGLAKASSDGGSLVDRYEVGELVLKP